ncbi:branched-chain amino acid ABC transporter permease [Bradyrhizobium sp.]|uniref:branched-chain amino acid ABC transporter permease n=1 Tax=Bradyrhizobium sp. TaxID=376 RepID=UPI0027340F27|nr:branched-chain amino acid ABC transporter permease [Bradyrhizobium sp.]MDP3076421.1 branched-chain amino acid ABC transporter permease [Bradyrhizobium sp.]
MLLTAVEGLAYGGLYALLGLGFFLTYGVLRRIDLAYGTVVMTSVYLGAMMVGGLGLPWVGVLALTLVVGIPLSLLVAYLAFVLVRQDARFSMAATLGIWMVLEELMLQSPGRGRGQAIVNPLQDLSWWPWGLQIRIDHMVILGLALAVAGLLTRFLTRSRTGLAIRVSAYDASVAALLGISHARMMVLATVIASAVGCVAGWSFAMAQSGIDLHFGMWATVKGLVILVLGGTQSIALIVTAAIGLGVAERVGSELIGSGYRDLVGYGLILALLAVEPFLRPGETRFGDSR